MSTNKSAKEGEKYRQPLERPGPKGGKRDSNRHRRIAQITEAALELFLHKGVMGTTIDQIVAAAKIAKGSFYRYFQDKEDLVGVLFQPIAKALEDAFSSCEDTLRNTEDHESLISAYVDLAQKLGILLFSYRSEVMLYLQESRGPKVGARKPISQVGEKIAAYSLHLTEVAHERHLLRPFPAEISALAVIGAIEQLLFAQLHGADLGEANAISTALISMVMEGLQHT